MELEITESVLLKDSRANLATLDKLRDMGVRIALDDFGTGYSSLGYLQRFPFSKIKIVTRISSDLPSPTTDRTIARLSLLASSPLVKERSAEGVETKAPVGLGRSGMR